MSSYMLEAINLKENNKIRTISEYLQVTYSIKNNKAE